MFHSQAGVTCFHYELKEKLTFNFLHNFQKSSKGGCGQTGSYFKKMPSAFPPTFPWPPREMTLVLFFLCTASPLSPSWWVPRRLLTEASCWGTQEENSSLTGLKEWGRFFFKFNFFLPYSLYILHTVPFLVTPSTVLPPIPPSLLL